MYASPRTESIQRTNVFPIPPGEARVEPPVATSILLPLETEISRQHTHPVMAEIIVRHGDTSQCLGRIHGDHHEHMMSRVRAITATNRLEKTVSLKEGQMLALLTTKRQLALHYGGTYARREA